MCIDVQTASNIILSILSLILAAISIFSAIKAIDQNNKAMEIATRPYVSIYFDFMNVGIPVCYFVIRNTGASPAVLTDLDCNDAVWDIKTDLCDFKPIIARLRHCTVAPGQKILLPFRLSDAPERRCRFEVKYSGNNKSYSNSYEIDLTPYAKMNKVRFDNGDMQYISRALQEISERLM